MNKKGNVIFWALTILLHAQHVLVDYVLIAHVLVTHSNAIARELLSRDKETSCAFELECTAAF